MTEQQQRWQGFTHEELFKLINAGPGASASALPAGRWAELAKTLNDLGQDLKAALTSTGSGWVGRAAGAAYDRLAPMADWATASGEVATAMRVAVENQGDYIAKARADMPKPDGEATATMAPDPTVAPAVQIAGALDDKEPVEAARSTGAQRAFEVMAAYQQATTANLEPLTPLDTPAELTGGKDHRNHRGPGISMTTVPSAASTVVVPEKHGHHHKPHPMTRETVMSHAVLSGGTLEAHSPRLPAPASAPGAVPMETLATPVGAPKRDEPAAEKPSRPTQTTPIVRVDETPAAPAAIGGNHASAAPPVSAAPQSTPADRMALRRFGTEALGSSQWFGDAGDDMAPSRTVSGRRRDLSATENVTESVSVDGEDMQLPPTVIGG